MQSVIQKIFLIIRQTPKLVLLAVLVFALLLAAAVTYFTLDRLNTKISQNLPSRPTFPNYLKPSSEIKVGGYRYVSPCQVLPLDDVEKIFGSLADDAYISEEYYETSATSLERYDKSVTTGCRYIHDREVSLSAEQGFEGVRTDMLSFALYPLGDDKMAAKIKLYEQATANSDKSTKDFVAKLKRSVVIYSQQEDAEDDSSTKIDTTNLIVPVDRGIFSFNVIHENVVYKFDYKHKDWPTDQLTLPDEDVVMGLKKSARALEIIQKRVADKRLDQSPAPTILGDTDKHGRTKILDACMFLTPELYQTVVGAPANKATDRTSVYKNINKERFGGDGAKLSPTNSCDRNGRANDTSTAVRLSMRYAPSAESSAASIQKGSGFQVGSNDKLLETRADWAGYFNIDAPTGGRAEFRVGPYLGSLTILHTSSAGLFSEITQTGGTEQQYVELTNAIADSVRHHSR